MQVSELTIAKLSAKIATGEISVVDLVDEIIRRIERIDPKVNSYITVLEDGAREKAGRLDREARGGRRLGPLYGIPVAVKDIIYVAGARCTMGSRIFADYVSRESATVVSRLEDAGAIIIGKTNLHELASGTTNVNPHFGPCRNPWGLDRISGGSSGGSAASVSCGTAVASLGTDTSGSIRIPAAFCGVAGLKPTYGRVSKHGVFPLSPSLDHVGPIARTALDCALLLRCMAGYDPRDDSSADEPVPDYLKGLEETRTTLAVPRNYFLDLVSPEVETAFWTFAKKMESMGFKLNEVKLETADLIQGSWAPVRRAEASAIHEDLVRARPTELGADVRRMLEDGMKYTAVEYIKAQKNRGVVLNDLKGILKHNDAVIAPSTITTAPKLGITSMEISGKVLDVYSSSVRLAIPFNITGLPAVTIPIALSNEGLPIGAQIAAGPFGEATALAIAHRFEESENTVAKFMPDLSKV